MTSKYDFPADVREQTLARDLGRCVRCGRFLPPGVAHLHHRKLRSQGGPGTIENAVTLCPQHHGWVHAHPAEARHLGLIVPSWADPECTPVVTWRGTVLQAIDGTLTTATTDARPSDW